MNIKNITAAHLRRAADIKDEIAALQREFDDYFTESPVLKLNKELEPKKTWTSAWTPERTRKFKRTMRLKRLGKK